MDQATVIHCFFAHVVWGVLGEQELLQPLLSRVAAGSRGGCVEDPLKTRAAVLLVVLRGPFLLGHGLLGFQLFGRRLLLVPGRWNVGFWSGFHDWCTGRTRRRGIATGSGLGGLCGVLGGEFRFVLPIEVHELVGVEALRAGRGGGSEACRSLGRGTKVWW